MRFIYHMLILLLVSETIFAMPAQILFMRHGEKPLQGDELSEQGWQRARALPSLFLNRPEFQKYGAPVALYAMSPEKVKGSVRAIQTLKYVSQLFHLPLDTRFTRDQVDELINNIKSDKNFDGKMIVVCWEHKVLVQIAQKLGLSNKYDWKSEIYDRVWELNFSNSEELSSFVNRPQRLLPTDSKN